MANNKKKVDRYHSKYQEADQNLEKYLDEVGAALFEGGFTRSADDFRDRLEAVTDARENARLQLERVVREEEIGVGSITVSERTTVTYNGAFLYDLFESNPKVRDRLIEVVYKVKGPEFNKLSKAGHITPEQATQAVVARKRSIALKGVPKRVGLA